MIPEANNSKGRPRVSARRGSPRGLPIEGVHYATKLAKEDGLVLAGTNMPALWLTKEVLSGDVAVFNGNSGVVANSTSSKSQVSVPGSSSRFLSEARNSGWEKLDHNDLFDDLNPCKLRR